MWEWLTLDTIDGKRKRVRVYGNTKAEIKRNKEQRLREYSGNSSVTFGAYKQQWFETYKSNRQAATKEMYENAMRKTTPIDHMDLSEITTSHLQKIINANFEHYRSCAVLRQFLNQVYECAIRDGKVAKNPVVGLQMPIPKRNKQRTLTQDEKKALKEIEFAPKERLFIDLMYYLGLRPGECLALTKEDFSETEVTINKAVGFDKNQPYIKPTKTYETRTVPIPDALNPDLDNLFGIISKSGYYDMWRRIKKKITNYLGYETDLHPYIFRHDYCTRCYYMGLTPLMTSKLMGNSVQMVLCVYAHLEEDKEPLDDLKKMVL